ncbi:MAG TPA: hypothetical protein VHO01_02905 [Jatrophihabitans sp.]|nr:hypothetical protein [Jatrophihabitans sp.]
MATQLLLCAIVSAGEVPQVSWVADTFLESIAEDISLPVLELRLAGMWRRDGHGYALTDLGLRQALATLRRLGPTEAAPDSSDIDPDRHEHPC